MEIAIFTQPNIHRSEVKVMTIFFIGQIAAAATNVVNVFVLFY